MLWTEDDYLGPVHVETSAGHEEVDGRSAAPGSTGSPPGGAGEVGRPVRRPSKAFLDALVAAGDGRGRGIGAPGVADGGRALAAHEVVDGGLPVGRGRRGGDRGRRRAAVRRRARPRVEGPLPTREDWPMPLSEEELRILQEIEANLTATDPALVQQVSETTLYRHAARSIKWAVFGFVAGLVLLVVHVHQGARARLRRVPRDAGVPARHRAQRPQARQGRHGEPDGLVPRRIVGGFFGISVAPHGASAGAATTSLTAPAVGRSAPIVASGVRVRNARRTRSPVPTPTSSASRTSSAAMPRPVGRVGSRPGGRSTRARRAGRRARRAAGPRRRARRSRRVTRTCSAGVSAPDTGSPAPRHAVERVLPRAGDARGGDRCACRRRRRTRRGRPRRRIAKTAPRPRRHRRGARRSRSYFADQPPPLAPDPPRRGCPGRGTCVARRSIAPPAVVADVGAVVGGRRRRARVPRSAWSRRCGRRVGLSRRGPGRRRLERAPSEPGEPDLGPGVRVAARARRTRRWSRRSCRA